MTLVLHGYWRSGAAYRVRIGLALKGLAYEQANHDLRTGAQRAADYVALNPQGLVPALQTPDGLLTQSLAILEWLEETHPAPPLLPAAPADRARVRSMAALIACDIHPLNNLRALKAMEGHEPAPDWAARWIRPGFDALEKLVERDGGAWSFGDAPTLADCCLIPQIYSARRFGIDPADWPRLAAIEARAAGHPAFQAAHPSVQPDADPA